MRFVFRVGTLIVLVVLGSCTLSARAGQVIVGNLSATPDPVASPSVIDPFDFWAQEFTSGVAATLQNIDASLGNFSAGNNGDFVLTAAAFPGAGSNEHARPGNAHCNLDSEWRDSDVGLRQR